MVMTNSSFIDVGGQLISNDVERLIDRLKSAILIPIFFLIGSPTNCLSLAVFYRLGLARRVNLCLFCLAFVDLLSTSFDLVLYAERVYNQFTTGERNTQAYIFIANHKFMGFYGCGYLAMIFMAIIACDRCLCILLPIKAKAILGVKAMAAILFVLSTTTFFSSFFIALGYRVDCFYEVITQAIYYKKSLTDFYSQNKAVMTALDNIFIGFFISLGCPLTVFVATIVMVIKLRKTVEWRKNATDSDSSKEIALTKMLLALSVEFLICSVPHFLFWITPLFVPDFRVNRLHANTKEVLLSFAQLASNLRSSANFFVYYTFGTRYRESVRNMCGGRAIKNMRTNTVKLLETKL